MNLQKHIHTVIGFLLIALVSVMAFAANFDRTAGVYECLTKEHVIIAQERSLSGVSLTCNNDILQENLVKQAIAK